MTYAGYEVLPVTHNLRESIAESFARSGELLGSGVGVRTFDDHAGLALPERSFLWTCVDRAACDVLRAFLDARKGRLVPFWVPTCCRDFELVADTVAGVTLTTRRSGYVDYLWSLGAPRRHVAIFPAGPATLLPRKITNAVLATQTTETLTLDSTTGVGLTAARTVISFLVLCRLAEDLTEIGWSSVSRCEAAIRFVELPREVPA